MEVVEFCANPDVRGGQRRSIGEACPRVGTGWGILLFLSVVLVFARPRCATGTQRAAVSLRKLRRLLHPQRARGAVFEAPWVHAKRAQWLGRCEKHSSRPLGAALWRHLWSTAGAAAGSQRFGLGTGPRSGARRANFGRKPSLSDERCENARNRGPLDPILEHDWRRLRALALASGPVRGTTYEPRF